MTNRNRNLGILALVGLLVVLAGLLIVLRASSIACGVTLGTLGVGRPS